MFWPPRLVIMTNINIAYRILNIFTIIFSTELKKNIENIETLPAVNRPVISKN